MNDISRNMMVEFAEDFSDMTALLDTTLPDPGMIELYRRLRNREIVWNDNIDDATIDIALYIRKWNKEDRKLILIKKAH